MEKQGEYGNKGNMLGPGEADKKPSHDVRDEWDQFYHYISTKRPRVHRNRVVNYNTGPRKNPVQSDLVTLGINHQVEVPHSLRDPRP